MVPLVDGLIGAEAMRMGNVAGETAALGAATILLLGFGMLVVNRRRPE